MNPIFKANIHEIAQKEHAYLLQKHHTESALDEAKHQCRLMMSKPEVIAGFVIAGAYKGAVDARPKATRNNVLLVLTKRAIASLFQ